MKNLKDLIDESELELLLDALRRYEKHCRGIADKPTAGYGNASEKEKKQQWRDKADALAEIETKIAYEFI